MQNKNDTHIPVLLPEVISTLNPQKGESYFDGTAGYGGHAGAILERLGPRTDVVLVDQDEAAIQSLEQRFGSRATITRGNYAEVAKTFQGTARQFDLILLDLGVASPQFDNMDRGFSFKGKARLDMRMNQTQALDAWTVVNTYKEVDLARIIATYGEERRARAVARAIIAARPLETTADLARVVRTVVRSTGDIDPATRTFQAIRIEVNAELASLEQGLPILLELLAPGGRIAVISFHSLEDRLVKTLFEQESKDCICPPKQPICTCNHQASIAKIGKRPMLGRTLDSNPRARSATLRAAVKLTPKHKEVA